MLTSIFRAGTISVHLTIEARLVHRMVEFARSASIFIPGIKAADKVARVCHMVQRYHLEGFLSWCLPCR